MKFLRIFRRRKRRKDPLSVLTDFCAANKIALTKAVHVGAHHGEEFDDYEAFGFREILWLEASPTDFAVLQRNMETKRGRPLHSAAVCAFLSDSDGGEVTLRRFNNDGASSSMFAGTELMAGQWPGLGETGIVEQVTTATLDVIAEDRGFSDAGFLAVDVQGAELLVLRGAGRLLQQVQALIIEVSQKPFYEGGALYPELKKFLEDRGFVEMTEAPVHGDQLYIRRDLVPDIPQSSA